MSLSFPPPCRLMSMNDRQHWRARSRDVRAWRTAAWAAGIGSELRSLSASIVTIELPVADRRRRDPHNYFATVKPIIDGLVDAGLWPDDTPEWVTTTEPRLAVGTGLVVVYVVTRDGVV